MKGEIRKILEKAVSQKGVDFSVEVPGSEAHGDYSTNVALVLAKQAGKNPREMAEEIKQKVERNKLFKKVEVAGPGFINFFLANSVFVDEIRNIDKNIGKNKVLKNKKIAIEYTDPNPFKEFHIGHLMSNAIGESVSRILEFQGARVKRFCYQGDVGLHVAKAIWGKMQNPGQSWGQAYVAGSAKYEEDSSVKEEIGALNKKIYLQEDDAVNRLYAEGKKESLEHFNRIYQKLGTTFDYFIFESEVMDIGRKIVEDGLKKGIFETGETGAIIFKGEKVGLHTRVFMSSENLPTYETKELGLATLKEKKYKTDSSVIITANEQNDHFKVVLAVMKELAPALANKTRHMSHGLLRLPEGKMSSRAGNVITGEALILQMEALVNEKVREREVSEVEKKNIAEAVGIGAIKYSILKQSIGSDIIYDFEKSISFEGDSGPYLQYAYTRAQSVMRKAKTEKIKPTFKKVPEGVSPFEKMLCRFSDVVLHAGEAYQPNEIATYLTELASAFNAYYAKQVIVDTKDELSPYKVAITEAFTHVMCNGLWLLGMQAPEKM